MTRDEQVIHDWLVVASQFVRKERSQSMRFLARDIAMGWHRFDPRRHYGPMRPVE